VEQTHSLLKRQLKRHLGDLDSLSREWQTFLEAVNTAYEEYDDDRRMLERSLELSSQELLQRNSEMRAVFQAFPDLFFRLDAEGTILDYTAGSTTDLYLPPEKLIGKRIQDIPLKDAGKKFQEALQQLKETQSLVSMEYSLKIEKQEQFYEARLLPLPENQVIVIVRNITERKQAEETLKQSEERYRTLFAEAIDGICLADAETGIIIDCNQALATLVGRDKSELIGQHQKILHPFFDDNSKFSSTFKQHLGNEAGKTLGTQVITGTGEIREVEIKANLLYLSGKKVLQGIFSDITVRKRAEELLRTSEAQLSNAMKIAKLAYWEYDVANDLFTFNDHFYAIFHTTAEQVGGYKMSPARYAQTFLHPDDIPVVAVEMKKALETTDPHFSRQLEHRIIYADGEVGYIAVSFFVVKDDQGRTIKTYGANQDITERKRAEETLGESEERYKALFEGSAEGILVADIETKEFKYANAAMCTMLGYTEEELIHMSIIDIHPQEALEHVISEFEAQARGEKKLAPQIPCLRKDGIIIYTDVTTAKVVLAGRECNVGFFTDITERKKTEEALRKSEHRYRSYIELTNQLAWVTNNDGGIVVDIPDWRKYTGQSYEEIKGLGWSKVIHPDDVERVMQVWQQAVKTRSAYEAEYRIRRFDGIYRYFLARGIPVFNQEGTIQEWVGTCIDVTELKKTEENLRGSMKEAEEANRLKSQFLANMSHEIRTPMNAIIGMTGIMLDTNLSDEQREYLRIVKESSYSLLGLLDDILDLSKIEAGRVELENIDFDLRTMVEGVIDNLITRASSKELELACSIDSAVPPFLRGDPARLRQTLINLGGNAIKFTEKGEVVIQVELQAETEEHATLLFSVTDTGIGIPEDKTAKIFESFTQADGSTTRKYGGTGLGLSISKRLVELMQGEIGVESQPGKGSRFWFTVNLEKQKGLKEILPPVVCNPQGCRILVVDDNQTNRTILTKMLESFKCVPQAVESGKKAIQILKQNYNQKDPFDLILLDMQMPEMDGEETLRLIQSDPLIKRIPVVILTSIGQRGDTARLEALGAAGYLPKPVKQSQLYDTLITILSKKKAQAESWLDPIITSDIVSKQKRQEIRLLVAEDNPTNQKLAVTLLKRAGFSVEAVDNGKLVMEALKEKAYDLVFMDVQMPEMDGLEATRAIREMEGERQHTPIIAMTAHVMKGDRERCLEAGMDDYISKPIEPKVMFSAIEKWIKPTDKKDRTLPVNQPKKGEPVKDIPLDMETTLKRFDGDKEFFKELMLEFLDHIPKQIQALNEAVKKGDAKLIEMEAHTIKGAAGNLGANNLADSALRLEQLGRTGNLDGGDNLIADLQKELKRLDEYARQSLGIESTEKIDVKP
jgi:two-component system sensor histidine kinase/response regulator